MKSIRRAGSSVLVLVTVLLLGPVAGCGDESSVPARGQDAGCTAPVRGSRYGVCGAVTTGFISTGTGHTVAGAVDAASDDTAGRYSVVGGTFHAQP